MLPPLYATLIQSTICNAVSNILAQIIDQWNSKEPFKFNVPNFLQFIVYCVIIVPINFYWQRWMEHRFPGFPSFKWVSSWLSSSASSARRAISSRREAELPTVVIPIEDLAAKDKKQEDIQQSSSSTNTASPFSLKYYWSPKRKSTIPTTTSSSTSPRRNGTANFLKKFLLDQTVGSVMNVWLFIVLINLLKGKTWGYTFTRVNEDMPGVMIARFKYRPVVAALMYTVIPVDRRVVFGSFCGVIWSVYLSLHSLSR